MSASEAWCKYMEGQAVELQIANQQLKRQLQEGAEIIRCLLLFDIHECETKNMANRFIEQIKTMDEK